MHFTTLTTSAVAALALLSSSTLANPTPQSDTLSPRTLDIAVKFYSTTTCNDSGGPDRDYVDNTCLALPESSHGVKIRSRRTGCYLVRYTGGNCDGESQRLDDTSCRDIGDEWNSLKFVCD